MIWAALALGGTLISPAQCSSVVLEPGVTNDLTLGDFLQLVVERNESLQGQVLQFAIARKRLDAERWIFEPDLVLSYDRVENERENTAEQRRSTGVLVFDEKNNIYEAGIEGLVPTGAKIRLGYMLRDLHNNLQRPTPGTIVTNTPSSEYQTFIGLNVTQPLLRDAWFPATLAKVRLAALGSGLAFQEYRRQMMRVISTAEATYWNFYLTQEQVRFFRESAALAESLQQDNEAKFRAGRASELEVLESTSGLALRKTRLAEAEQRYFEAVSQMLTLIAQPAKDPMPILRAIAPPSGSGSVPSFEESGRLALELNPDYLGLIRRLDQEKIRVAYARNQRLPQVDLRASYGLNGLGYDPGNSWEDVQHRGFPAFVVGIEWRIPLGGGRRTKHELDAARLAQEQALVALKEMETQILNAIATALRRIRSTHTAIGDYEQIAAFNRSVLDTELMRLEVGTVGVRQVLEADAGLFEAKNAVVDAHVQNERARLELEVVQGTILRSRNLDRSQEEIGRRTATQLSEAGVTEGQYEGFLQGLRLNYEPPVAPPDTRWPAPAPGIRPEDYERALRELHRVLAEPNGTEPRP